MYLLLHFQMYCMIHPSSHSWVAFDTLFNISVQIIFLKCTENHFKQNEIILNGISPLLRKPVALSRMAEVSCSVFPDTAECKYWEKEQQYFVLHSRMASVIILQDSSVRDPIYLLQDDMWLYISTSEIFTRWYWCEGMIFFFFYQALNSRSSWSLYHIFGKWQLYFLQEVLPCKWRHKSNS